MGERRNRVATNSSTGGGSAASKVARVLSTSPDRVAAAWRRVRFADGPKGDVPDNLLDDVVENFVREIGRSLAGAEGSAWSRTRGVLRISTVRGVRALYDEFGALRRCLVDAVEVLGGEANDRGLIHAAVDEAVQSAVALYSRMQDPFANEPGVPFGGVVVEYFERPRAGATHLHSVPNVH